MSYNITRIPLRLDSLVTFCTVNVTNFSLKFVKVDRRDCVTGVAVKEPHAA